MTTEHAEKNALEAIQASVAEAQRRGMSTIDEGDSSEEDDLDKSKEQDGSESDNDSRSFGTEDPVVRRVEPKVTARRKTRSKVDGQDGKPTPARKSTRTRKPPAPAMEQKRPKHTKPQMPEPPPPDDDSEDEESPATSPRHKDVVEEDAPHNLSLVSEMVGLLKSYLLKIRDLIRYALPFLTRLAITVGICYFLLNKYSPRSESIPSQPQQKPYDSSSGFTRDLTNLMRRVTSLEYALVSPAPPPARINWFSPGLGAVIDPYLTSPTYKSTIRTGSWLRWSEVLKTDIGNPDIPGPAKVLRPWDDVGDCWCAPGTNGRSQVTIRLSEKIAPTDLVIEHVAIDATLDRGSAPKDVELWVQLEDRAAFARVYNAAASIVDRDLDTATSNDQVRKDPDYRYEAPGALDYNTWVRVGVWRYDIYAGSNVQSFRIGVDMEELQAPVEAVSVRVRNNWGPKPYTCLYRLKLHGLLAQPVEE
jgi:hypothetical protein